MRKFVITGAAMFLLAACGAGEEASQSGSPVDTASFDGADYSTEAEMLAHGDRLAKLLSCNSCHQDNYAGIHFGEAIPLVDGLYASNISVAMPSMSDAELEVLLRDGIHPDRGDMFVMPSKATHFLSEPDMRALIGFLRSIPPVGEELPPPPPGFQQTMADRLGFEHYHSAAEEVAEFVERRAPAVSADTTRGYYIATIMCTACHGAGLDGIGEPAGDIQLALEYSDEEFERLLTESVDRTGKRVIVEWGFGHESMELTASERKAAIAYTRKLAEQRAQ